MSDLKEIEVNGKRYHVEKMSVKDTLQMQVVFVSTFGGSLGGLVEMFKEDSKASKEEVFQSIFSTIDPNKTTKIFDSVFARVITPTNEYLKNAAIFEQWFKENPDDLWFVLGKAIVALLGEYLPKQLVTMAQSYSAAKGQSPSKSHKVGK
jgi:hypothetical protein